MVSLKEKSHVVLLMATFGGKKIFLGLLQSACRNPEAFSCAPNWCDKMVMSCSLLGKLKGNLSHLELQPQIAHLLRGHKWWGCHTTIGCADLQFCHFAERPLHLSATFCLKAAEFDNPLFACLVEKKTLFLFHPSWTSCCQNRVLQTYKITMYVSKNVPNSAGLPGGRRKAWLY